MSKKEWRVSAPIVQAKLANGTPIQLYRDDVIPELDADNLKHLKDLGFVTTDEPKTEADESGDKPAESSK